MRIVLRRFEIQGGQKVPVDRALDLDRVTLGRGTDQDVQLPDLRVALQHAEIRAQAGGPYYVSARSNSGVWVNGAPSSGRNLGFGDVLDCGRFRIAVGTPDLGVDLLLEVEERMSAREDRSQRQAQFATRLDQGGLGKRRAGWLLFLAFLLPGLAVPAVLSLLPGEGPTPLHADHVWDTGEFSAAHAYFGQDCGRCHETPFVRVRNDACLSCHKDRPHHADDAEALAVESLGKARCESCHHEHGGRRQLVARHPALCTDCHADLAGEGFPDRGFGAARNFERDHPDVSPTLPRYDAAKREFRWVRTAPGATSQWQEESNLLFPHDVHLDPRGVGAPEGKRVLECAACHVPEGDGRGFQPVRMEPHCAECHRLDFDPQDPQRLVPHAQPAQVAAVVRDHYARRALDGRMSPLDAAGDTSAGALQRRPGEEMTPEQSQAARRWAEERAQLALRDLFERRVCAQCHVVTPREDAEEPWAIAPVALTRDFLTGARFSHRAHATEKCASCHDAAHSRASADVLMPTLAGCRECHGDADSGRLVPTSCVDCHGFHIARKATIGGAGARP